MYIQIVIHIYICIYRGTAWWRCWLGHGRNKIGCRGSNWGNRASYIYIYIHLCVCLRSFKDIIEFHLFRCLFMDPCMCIYIYIYLQVMCICIYMYVYIYIWLWIYIYIYRERELHRNLHYVQTFFLRSTWIWNWGTEYIRHS